MRRIIVISAAMALFLSLFQTAPVLQGSPAAETPTVTATPRRAEGGTIAMGQTVSGLIHPKGRTDFWSFQGNMGDLVIITMEASQARTLDPYLELLDPTGLREAYDLDSGPGLNARISKRLAKSGVYTVVAKDYNGISTGNYVLRLTSPSHLPSLPFGPIVSGNIETPGFSQLWTFPGTFDQNVIVTMDAAAGSQLDPYLELLNPDGFVEASGIPGSTSVNERIARRLSATGAYTVVASDYWASTSGAYTLGLISPTGATPTPTPTPTPTATPTPTPQPPTVGAALSSIEGKYTMVWHFDNSTGAWKLYNAANPAAATIAKLEAWKGYWIAVTEDCTLTVGGASIPLYKGWNLVGWSR